MELILVGAGGAVGSVVRFWIGQMISKRSVKRFPVATWVVNVSGALLLGVAMGLGFSYHPALLLADGFLGAYTTFSTFMYEGFHLFKDNRTLDALVYIAGTMLSGIMFFMLGLALCGAV